MDSEHSARLHQLTSGGVSFRDLVTVAAITVLKCQSLIDSVFTLLSLVTLVHPFLMMRFEPGIVVLWVGVAVTIVSLDMWSRYWLGKMSSSEALVLGFCASAVFALIGLVVWIAMSILFNS